MPAGRPGGRGAADDRVRARHRVHRVADLVDRLVRGLAVWRRGQRRLQVGVPVLARRRGHGGDARHRLHRRGHLRARDHVGEYLDRLAGAGGEVLVHDTVR